MQTVGCMQETTPVMVYQPFVDSVEMKKLKDDLMGYTGTEEWHKEGMSVIYTDGIKDLIELAKCWWLVSDLSVVSQIKFPRVPFQIWTLQVMEGKGTLTMKEDTNRVPKYTQQYTYTDFPDGTFKMYLVDGVLMLPSEY